MTNKWLPLILNSDRDAAQPIIQPVSTLPLKDLPIPLELPLENDLDRVAEDHVLRLLQLLTYVDLHFTEGLQPPLSEKVPEGEGREGVHGLVVVLPRYKSNRGGLEKAEIRGYSKSSKV